MDKQRHDRIQKLLQELHEELEQAGEVDEDLAQPLSEVMNDIKGVLHQGDHEGLADRLESAVRNFEGRHPDLARAIGGVARSLSSIGL